MHTFVTTKHKNRNEICKIFMLCSTDVAISEKLSMIYNSVKINIDYHGPLRLDNKTQLKMTIIIIAHTSPLL